MNRVALVTEWNGEYGGAENVNLEICKLFHEYPEVHSIWNENPELLTVRDSPLRILKNTPKQFAGFLSFFHHLLGLSKKYELVISSSFMYAHLSRSRNRNAKHLVYVHTPIRYIWSPSIDERAHDWRYVFLFASPILKKLELHFLDRNAVFVCNSQEVSMRIARYWGIAASVINPPVDIEFYRNFVQIQKPNSLQLISAGRFVKYKNHDMAIELARKLNCKLILAGSGPEEVSLRRMAIQTGVDVDFVISPKRDTLANLISKSSVFLHLAHEDFGILPIEAMSTGTPVVGFSVGGLCETVNEVNGRLSQDFEGLTSSITEAVRLDRLKVSASIEKYSSKHFRREIQDLIVSRWPEFTSRLAIEGDWDASNQY